MNSSSELDLYIYIWGYNVGKRWAKEAEIGVSFLTNRQTIEEEKKGIKPKSVTKQYIMSNGDASAYVPILIRSATS